MDALARLLIQKKTRHTVAHFNMIIKLLQTKGISYKTSLMLQTALDKQQKLI